MDRRTFIGSVASGLLAVPPGVVLVRLGRLDDRIMLVDRACAALTRHRASHFQLPFVLQAEAYLAAGRAADAVRAAEECVQPCRRRGERRYECWSLTIESEAALANDGWESAQRRGTAALAFAETTGQLSVRGRCAALLAKLG